MQFCERSGQRKTSAPDVGRALGREFDIGLKPSKNPASRSLTDNKQFVAIDDQAFQIGLIVMTSCHVDPGLPCENCVRLRTCAHASWQPSDPCALNWITDINAGGWAPIGRRGICLASKSSSFATMIGRIIWRVSESPSLSRKEGVWSAPRLLTSMVYLQILRTGSSRRSPLLYCHGLFARRGRAKCHQHFAASVTSWITSLD